MTLSAAQVKALEKPGRYTEGGGLHLYISRAGSKPWVQRITVHGRRRDIGLGGYPSTSPARAREKAAANRTAVADGRDPMAKKRKPAMPTLGEAPAASTRRPRLAGTTPSKSRSGCKCWNAMRCDAGQHTYRPHKTRGCLAGAESNLDEPSGDGAADASTNADHFPLGDGARVHGGEPCG